MSDQRPVVLVTGGSRGLGRGIAIHAARAGCSVAVNYVSNEQAAQETVALCMENKTQTGQQCVAIKGDIAVRSERNAIVQKTLDELGRIDALVNNAGVGPKERVDVLNMSEESYRKVMTTNLEGPHFLTQQVAMYWTTKKPKPLLPGGFAVVFISSVSAEMVSVNRGEYCMSKAGLSMCAQLWATRLAGEGISVCEIRPGIMSTDMTSGVKQKYESMMADGIVPQRRWGTADDVGKAVRAILEGSLPFSAGTVIHIDGGLTIPRL